jgi:hypothetical protein
MSHPCQVSATTAVEAKIGRNASSHNTQPALATETTPSPARTCGSSHQLGTSKAAMVERIPAVEAL